MKTAENITLILPRPLVNKILAHAQQHETGNSKTGQPCGIISRDNNNNCYFYPFRPSTAITASRHCFDKESRGFSKIQPILADRQQTLLACVFAMTESSTPLTADNNLFPVDQCFYVVTSLNTRGVIEMQGFYRNTKAVHKVSIELEQDD